MSFGHDDGAMPAVHRQPHQMRKQLLGPRRNREVDPVAGDHLGNLLRGALVQMQPHLGILRAKFANHRRQHVTRLGVRGRDGQRAPIGFAQLRGGAADILHLAQDAAGTRNDLLSRRRGAGERPALALEQLESELLLQQLELPAHPRLRGVQLPRGGRDVEAVLMHGHEIA
jgi:hypothetical protein